MNKNSNQDDNEINLNYNVNNTQRNDDNKII